MTKPFSGALLVARLAAAALAGALLAPGAQIQAQAGTNDMAKRVAPCIACHGEQGRAGRDAYYPRIAGKPEGYLYNQLVNFREGRRQYALMTYLVDHLPDAYLAEIAGHFARLDPPYPPPAPPRLPSSVLARGRTVVVSGDAGRRIPACAQCHGDMLMGRAPAIPGLLGLPQDYVSAQLGAWRAGTRRSAAPDCMAEIARRLAPEDAAAVSAWLAAQPVPAQGRPAPEARKLPLRCGVVPLPSGSAGR